MKITFVKKILANGAPCRKCVDVETRLHRDGWQACIDRVVLANEDDPASEGMVLAAQHNVDRAPFFLVEHPDGRVDAQTIYFRFVREVLEPNCAARLDSAAA